MSTYQPVILTAELRPNPATVGETVLLSVSALDVEIIEQTEARMSGELRAGEV